MDDISTARIELVPERTCCFTGHRPNAFPFGEDDAECLRIKSRLREEILRHVGLGVDTFIIGMAMGVDTWAGEICAELRDGGANLRLIAAIPCINQLQGAPDADKERYESLVSRCDDNVLLSEEYTAWCMQERDRYMVDNSRYVIGVYNGSGSGGTFYTLKYARKQKREVTVITTGTIMDI